MNSTYLILFFLLFLWKLWKLWSEMACVNTMKVSWSTSSIAKHGQYIHSNH